MPEQTTKDLLELMKQGDVREFIGSGAKMPEKHTEADRDLLAEVSMLSF